MSGTCRRYGEGRIEVNILVGNADGKRSIVRPNRMWEDNIKMDLQEVRWGMDWIWLMIGTGGGFMCGNDIRRSIKCGEFLD